MSWKAEGLLIIGFGNRLRGDDDLGPRVARELRMRGLPAVEAHQLTPELAETVSRVELAVFIDSDAHLKPGEIRITPVREKAKSVLEHHASPGGLLRLAREAYGCAPAALLIAIGGESYELGEHLSGPALRAVREVVDVCTNRV